METFLYMILTIHFPGSMALAGGLSALFLPETLHQKLPNTMREAQNFGKDQVKQPN